MNTKKNKGSALKAMAVLAAALTLAACNALENDSTSSTMLVVNSLMGTNNAGTSAAYADSDVLTKGGVLEDVAIATLAAVPLDSASETSVQGGAFRNIELLKYAVTYERTDGRNTQGTDVPYAFEAPLNGIIPSGGSVSVTLILVRAWAKLEPPLVQLVADGSATRPDVIACSAKVDFYGRDLGGHNVKATAYIPIYFADWADPEETEGGLRGDQPMKNKGARR